MIEGPDENYRSQWERDAEARASARISVLEEAAKECERLQGIQEQRECEGNIGSDDWLQSISQAMAFQSAAKAIRALKEKPHGL